MRLQSLLNAPKRNMPFYLKLIRWQGCLICHKKPSEMKKEGGAVFDPEDFTVMCFRCNSKYCPWRECENCGTWFVLPGVTGKSSGYREPTGGRHDAGFVCLCNACYIYTVLEGEENLFSIVDVKRVNLKRKRIYAPE